MKSVPVFGQKDTYLRNYVQEWNDATKEEARKALLCYKRSTYLHLASFSFATGHNRAHGAHFGWDRIACAYHWL